MNPSSHCQLCYEDFAALGKQERRFGGDHFDLGVSFHDLFDASEWKLVHFVIVLLFLQTLQR